MKQCNPMIAAVFAWASLAAGAGADPLVAGQERAAQFLEGDLEAIWSASTPDMQQAFGSPEGLAAFHQGLLAEFGGEEALVSEVAGEEAGLDTYRRVARWTKAEAPLELIISFDPEEKIAGFLIRPQPVAAPSEHLDYETKARLQLPFEGEWFVFWGGRDIEDNYHAADAGQRFALDLLVMEDGKSHSGDPARLESYHCWGRAILSPSEGKVVEIVDGLPDQEIGASDPQNPAGNHVVIDFGNGEYGFLAHLQQGSVRVAKGDVVTPGQEVGLCGNSGNTSEPHLHFHLQTSPVMGEGEGLPAQFLGYQADGLLVERGEPRRGEMVWAGG